MSYRRLASPLHAARAAVGCAYCLALALVAMVWSNPLVLAALVTAVVAAGSAAGVRAQLARAARLSLPIAVFFLVLNPLVSRHGLTVLARLGEVPVLGRLDITLETIVYGAVVGLQIVAISLAVGLFFAAVDPDEVLALFRRAGFRSALSASLATRMGPLLWRDGQRLAEAQRCRGEPSAASLAIVRAVARGALDRAVDVAATLELRGYGTQPMAPAPRRAWSRHDLAFAVAAGGVAALAVGARLAGVAHFHPYERLVVALDAPTLALCAALVLVAVLPFADRRGIAP